MCYVAADYLKVCTPELTGYTSCVANAASVFIETVQNGIPELDIPPLDPLVYIPAIIWYEQTREFGTYRDYVTDLELQGLKDLQLLDIQFTTPQEGTKNLTLTINIPAIHSRGRYIVSAKVLNHTFDSAGILECRYGECIILHYF